MGDSEKPASSPPESTRKWYGSIDESISKNGNEETKEESDVKTTLPSSNIHVSNEYIELDEHQVPDDKKALLEEFERKRRARLIHVSTDDSEVRQYLRDLGEPICHFGEDAADRRNRLKDVLSRKGEDGIKKSERESQRDVDRVPVPAVDCSDQAWYHQGPKSLKEARMFLVHYSVPKARAKIKKEKLERQIPEATRTARRQDIHNKVRAFALIGSQNADTRPISFCSFSPDGKLLATSGWSGMCKVWQVPQCAEKMTLRGHNSYADCIQWHPSATIDMEPTALNLVSSARDGTVNFWNLKDDTPIGEIPQLEARVSRVAFHPSGRFLGACVHDNSWRLWDLQLQEEILFQEGHSKPVYCIGFQNDGALAVTGGMDAFGRVWDLRTGRCIMFLSGHQNPVICVDWSPDGHHIITGGEDNTAKIWDVRARKCVYTIPAHTSIVSGVRYDPVGGYIIATCSYDGAVHLWCHGSFQPLRTLEGHGQKVINVDIAPDNSLIATCSFDRTFKLWGLE